MWHRKACARLVYVLIVVLVAIVSFIAGTLTHVDTVQAVTFDGLSHIFRRPPPGSGLAFPEPGDEQLAIFYNVWEIINKEYFDRPLDYDRMLDGALKGLLDSLGDPHSTYISPEYNRLLQDEEYGQFEGIGATVDQVDGKIVVIAPLPGSPAEKAGLQAGDVILKIDGESMEGASLLEVVSRVRGPAGTKVVLTVRRPGQSKPLDIVVTRAEISLNSVVYRIMPDQVGYIAIRNFGQRTLEELDAALDALRKAETRYLILDLRDDPGGFLDVAIEVLSRFVDEDGPAVYWVNADGSEQALPLKARETVDWPMVVLVNKGTASAAEILAGALQDYGRAIVVGERTFGKGSVQNVHELRNGGSVRITTAHWLTPRKRDINGTGITPDVEVLERPDIPSDEQLIWARHYLSGKIRPFRYYRPE